MTMNFRSAELGSNMDVLYNRPFSPFYTDVEGLEAFSLPADCSLSSRILLDGLAIDDWGFDPPSPRCCPEVELVSPTVDLSQLSSRPTIGFKGSEEIQLDSIFTLTQDHGIQYRELYVENARSIPDISEAIFRNGQPTPRRSISASTDKTITNLPKPVTPRGHRRNHKASAQGAFANTAPTSKIGRKPRTPRKSCASSESSEKQDDKRKISLEKNRLAAAKCRINKKERTEKLQRDSHDKAVHNAFLKEQVMRMREKIQQMKVDLLSHIRCDGCKSPTEIKTQLSNNLDSEFLARHVPSLDTGDIPHLNIPSDVSGPEVQVLSEFLSLPGESGNTSLFSKFDDASSLHDNGLTRQD